MARKEKREADELRVQWSKPDRVQCVDCVNRDRTIVEINGKKIPVGATRYYCDVYENKPTAILLRGALCDYFERADDS